MRLTVFSDYSLQVLMFIAASPDRLVTIEEIATAYGISENHLMKVVQTLARSGFVETVRGRGGGMRLGKPADQIVVGSVLRVTEEDFGLVECFRDQNACRVTRVCRLRGLLDEALAAFFKVVDGRTLADLMARPKQFSGALLAD